MRSRFERVKVDDCISKDLVNYTYCQGSCLASRYEPTFHLTDAIHDETKLSEKDCKCCTGEVSRETVLLACSDTEASSSLVIRDIATIGVILFRQGSQRHRLDCADAQADICLCHLQELLKLVKSAVREHTNARHHGNSSV